MFVVCALLAPWATTSSAAADTSCAPATDVSSVSVSPSHLSTAAGPGVVTVRAHLDAVTASVGLRGPGGTLTAGDLHQDGADWSADLTVPQLTQRTDVGLDLSWTDSAGGAHSASACAVDAHLTVDPTFPMSPAVSAARGDGSALVSWQPPPDDGGAPVTGYQVTVNPSGRVLTATSDQRSLSVDGLTNGQVASFDVAAVNDVGIGPSGSAQVVPAGLPSAPAVEAHLRNGAVRLSWTAPAANGDPVTGYVVQVLPAGPRVDVTGTGTLLTGLTNDTMYDVSVAARNGVGTSTGTVLSVVPTAGAGEPATATGRPVAVTGDGHALLHWTAPQDDGGQPVSGYLVTVQPGGREVRSAGPQLDVTGLTNGVAATLSVQAVTAVGPGLASPGVTVVPRRPGVLRVVHQAVATVAYAHVSMVQAQLVGTNGTALSGRKVTLLTRVRGTTAWVPVAHGTTGATGVVTVSTVLCGTSALLLRHDADAVGAVEVRATPVAVSATATAVPNASRLSAGHVLTMRGALSARRVGVTVRLEQRVGTGWVIRAAARTSATSAYALSWRPVRGGLMVLRVRIFPYGALIGGVTRSSTISVVDTSASLAREILANPRIQLATGHLSGVRDLADPLHEMNDLAAGRPAYRSSYGTAPGGSVMVTVATLRGLRDAGRVATIHVVELAGGTHARGSAHYLGLAFDIDIVNGRWVSYGSDYDVVVVSCRHSGATRIFHPAYDPYGGHGNHIHVDWLVQ